MDRKYLAPWNLTWVYEHRWRGVMVVLVLIKNKCLLHKSSLTYMAWLVAMEIFWNFPSMQPIQENKLCGMILFGRSVNGTPCSTKNECRVRQQRCRSHCEWWVSFQARKGPINIYKAKLSFLFFSIFLIIGLFMRMTRHAFLCVSQLSIKKTLWDPRIPLHAPVMLFSVTDAIDGWSIEDT